jgi:uncharacterized protein (DUF488 family)
MKVAPRPPGSTREATGVATRVYPIGRSNRPIGSFLTLLRVCGVALLADVRRFPRLRTHPQHGRDAVAASPTDAGIGYVFLGDALIHVPGEGVWFAGVG